MGFAGGHTGDKSSLRAMGLIVLGSSLFWVWGFLCYLSPVMFPPDVTNELSIGIEYGFFASQAGAALFATFIIFVSHWRRMIIKRRVFFAAALLMSLSALVLMVAVRLSNTPLILACGLIDGVCVPLLGVAWGTRYSLHSKTILPLVVISFLIAYLLYYLVSPLPSPVAIGIVAAMPLASWALWNNDARQRHEVSSEVFATKATDTEPATPGEFLAGTWETKIMPWRSLAILLTAAFIGNLITSIILGQGYLGVDVLYNGGILVCACIATMALSVIAARKNSPSVSDFYHITLTFTVVGLLGILVFGSVGIPVGGAFVQGGAMFLQVLVILTVTQSTQALGISPLLSFSVGQGVTAAVVFVANILGKYVHWLFGSEEFVLAVLCGAGLLILFVMLAAQANRPTPNLPAKEETTNKAGAIDPPIPLTESAPMDSLLQQRTSNIAQKYRLTNREEEILGYLAKGRSLPYIADTLFVTTGTVKTHTTNIYRKMMVSSRQELLDLIEGTEVDSTSKI